MLVRAASPPLHPHDHQRFAPSPVERGLAQRVNNTMIYLRLLLNSTYSAEGLAHRPLVIRAIEKYNLPNAELNEMILALRLHDNEPNVEELALLAINSIREQYAHHGFMPIAAQRRTPSPNIRILPSPPFLPF